VRTFACGFDKSSIETISNPLPGDIMDTPSEPWEKNPAAVALGRLNRGKKKKLSPTEKKRRREAFAEARKSRWPKK